MKYVFAAVAGIWMADGLALLVAPRLVMTRVREALALSPTLLRWEGVAVFLGVLLLLGTGGLHYQPLWLVAGGAMVVKGLFLAVGPEGFKKEVLEWCLTREDVDYRFWGLGLCTLAVLLLHAVGWLGNG
jgi:uncharacterized protein YjeT (DUF2065 family)